MGTARNWRASNIRSDDLREAKSLFLFLSTRRLSAVTGIGDEYQAIPVKEASASLLNFTGSRSPAWASSMIRFAKVSRVD
jgi:hypothetical protein